jgi:ankyrin repeat protein
MPCIYQPNMAKSLESIPSPLFYASLESLIESASQLVKKGANVNSQGGYYGNALQAASARGHEQIVQLLFEKGANVNARGGDYSNALQVASYRGHDQVVQQLLKKGANVNAQCGFYDNVLQAASAGGPRPDRPATAREGGRRQRAGRRM